MRYLCAILLPLLISLSSFANDYDEAWKAISKKKYNEATQLLQKALKNPKTAMDAYSTLLYLRTYQGNESEIPGMVDALVKDQGKNAYLFALWFNGAALGQYSSKNPAQLALVDRILDKKEFNGSITAAGNYSRAMYHVFSNQYEKAIPYWSNMNGLLNWQIAGPFDNLSGSGFYREQQPLHSPGEDAVFNGLNNIQVKWFTPVRKQMEGWMFCYPLIQQSTAIVYAQSFVYAPEDTKALLNLGGNGSLRVWVNDALVISESKERVTELDYYKNYCQLRKGYNRILVQLGFTRNSMPNFIIRLTDDNLQPLPGVTSTATVQAYPRNPESSTSASLPHFAETYFENKIRETPGNLVNYILLSETYLRNSRISEARQVIEKAVSLQPENPLLHFELAQVLIKADNKTQLSQKLDWFSENDPGCYVDRHLKIQELVEAEKYDEANDSLTEMYNAFQEDENMLQFRTKILGKLNQIDTLINVINEACVKYPKSATFAAMKYNVYKLIDKDTKAATSYLENFFKSNFEGALYRNFANEYLSLGQDSSYLKMISRLDSISEQDPTFTYLISQYYAQKQDYEKALTYGKAAAEMAPTVGVYWNNVASIYEQMKQKELAIENYKKSIYYDRTDYDGRKKLSKLEKKAELYKLLPDEDIYSLIKKTAVDTDYDYTYISDEKGTIIYEEGATEEYITYAVKINTQKGIDTWKETSLYGNSAQSLLVEKCEVVKPSGAKVSADRDDTHVVFTGLEPGDAVYVKYRLQNYYSGRLGREFWDKFIFNSFVKSKKARYTLVAPKNMDINSRFNNNSLKATVKEVDGYKTYTWQLNDLPALRSEALMPPLNDVASVLHISTIKSWDNIATWYSDIAYQDTKDNYDLDLLYGEIFKNKKPASEFEKAGLIYDYIVNNIRYSSVSFRQNNFIPQNISTIINTRLGDCKDLSMLFGALTQKAGISSQLVLIDTRDNGTNDMLLPSMEFNHCISLAKLDGKEYYVELTDSELPFTSLPANLNGALSLVIPSHGQKPGSMLSPLQSPNRKQDRVLTNLNISLQNNDVKLQMESKRYGAIVSPWRSNYATLTSVKQKERFEQTLSNNNKNAVKLESLTFDGLTGPGDVFTTNCAYTVMNDVVDAGSMKMIKIPYTDVIATLESLSPDSREYPIEYWNYENTDEYETNINIQIPEGLQLLEMPQDKTLKFKETTYSLKFVQEGNTIKIVRKANMCRKDIAAEDYDAFKKFFKEIVEAESKYLVFK